MASTEELIRTIEGVLALFPAVEHSWHSGQMTSGFRDVVAFAALRTQCAALGNYIYGEGHATARRIAVTIAHETLHHLKDTEGILRGTIEALKQGLFVELRTQVLLDIQTDFVEAGVRALDEGATEVSAVLAAVVLEDAVKRLADKSAVPEALDKEFSIAVAALFKADKITKATKGVLLGYKDLRNAALHAQWKEVSPEAVRSLLQYLPQFMEQYGV